MVRASVMRLKSLAICIRGWREKEKSYVASDELVAYLARSPTSSQSLTSLPLLSVLSCCALFFFFKFLIASDFQLLIADHTHKVKVLGRPGRGTGSRVVTL